MKNSASRAAPRFFVPVDLALGAEIRLPDRAAHHLAVLRLRGGDGVTLFNGRGGEFAAELVRVSAGQAWARVLTSCDPERESPLCVALASERSVVRLSGDRAEKRIAHWRNVVIAACEQCGRNRVPEVAGITGIEAFLDNQDPGGLRLLLDPEADRVLRELPRPKKVTLLVGPEGGLTERERASAERAGYVPVRFGPRVLRTETAPLAAIAAMQTLWGDC